MRRLLRNIRIAVGQHRLLRHLRKRPDSRLDDCASLLVVAPHPDDEIIGLGGFLARCALEARRVGVVYLTDGDKSLDDLSPSLVAGERRKLAVGALSRLGIPVQRVQWLGVPDGAVPRSGADGFRETAERLRQTIEAFRPDAVFVTHPLDTWPYDHVAAYELVAESARSLTFPCRLYGYWVWLWYSLPPDRIASIAWNDVVKIPLDGVMEEKKALMDGYLDPRCPDGRPWSGVLPDAMLRPFSLPFEVVQEFPVSSTR